MNTATRERPSRYMPKPQTHGPVQFGDCPTAWAFDNGYYYGILRRYASGFPVGGGEYAVISLTATDESARHDWRDFQQLKNWLVGDEWEGLELYPAETRLLDPSNRFYLWCVPKGVIRWGLPWAGRDVNGEGGSDAPQRPFPSELTGAKAEK